jgi:hypothetical protein
MSSSIEVRGGCSHRPAVAGVLAGEEVASVRMPRSVAALGSPEGLNAVLCVASVRDELHAVLILAGKETAHAAIVDPHTGHLREALLAWEAAGAVRIKTSVEQQVKTVEVPLHIDGWVNMLLQENDASLAEVPAGAGEFAKFLPALRRLTGIYQVTCDGVLEVA